MRQQAKAKGSGRTRSSVLRVLVGVVVGTVVYGLILQYLQTQTYPQRPSPTTKCLGSMKGLGLGLAMYLEEHGEYPRSENWCDLVVEHYREKDAKTTAKFRTTHYCPHTGEHRWAYAMNPLANRWSSPDVVLLFESDVGWNAFGGPEIMAADRHNGRGCVLFVDGSVALLQKEEIGYLRWRGELYDEIQQIAPHVPNARRPETREDLEYWLRNMVWYHRLSGDEAQAATGLKSAAIDRAQKVCDIYRTSRPDREADAPLLVLPYPGGRHPRIGFLEGAVEPQRETKFSVFTPWDPNSYVVVDVPEAIWSNLGLTYLAHTHIDTIWTKQGIELPKLEWNRRADGSLDIERTLPNGLAFGVQAVPARETVRIEMWLRNGTERRLTDLRVQICVLPKMAAGFAPQTNANKVFTNPYVACRSEDGQRWIITAWEGCQRPWGNEQCPCFHSDPKFPDLEPGQRHRLRGWLSFYEGSDIQAEFARIEATGWRRD